MKLSADDGEIDRVAAGETAFLVEIVLAVALDFGREDLNREEQGFLAQLGENQLAVLFAFALRRPTAYDRPTFVFVDVVKV